jgi:hypothetical protein
MKVSQEQWQALASLGGDDLKRRVFMILREAALAVNAEEADNPRLLEVVPRLADIISLREELVSFRQPFSALARATGLWNYIDREYADDTDRLIAETVSAPELG